ncbi:glycerophosphodiester phosphodiesterase [Synechococcus bigranulatus str. 'Rupite']|uniref:Glycerophosphodiester phosphodiesterase n=2 Tax=Thermostichus vulcanus TaxID=32053 RepID=A0ABT0C7S3_THEVL|nr:glycerophosphodiester phosphodiesterase [Thermostichus vulcanus str. 'Rupite']
MTTQNLCRVIAHRGDHTQAEENTLEAFTAAITIGADQIELDVRRSQDGILLIFHDADLGGQPLATLTWAEIQAHKPTIPTLQETLLHIKGKITLDIELKEAGYEEQVLALIRDSLTPEQYPDHYVITSFLPQVVQRVKIWDPELKVGLLVDRKAPESQDSQTTEYTTGSLFQYSRDLGADFLAPHHSWINPEFLNLATEAGIPLYVWTVNDPEQMRACLQSKIIQGLITDDPQLALQIRASLSGESDDGSA